LLRLAFLSSDLHGGGGVWVWNPTHHEPDRPPVHQTHHHLLPMLHTGFFSQLQRGRTGVLIVNGPA
jgi:hypothetical protein